RYPALRVQGRERLGPKMLNFSPRKASGICLLGLFGIFPVNLSAQPAPARAGGIQLLLEADTAGVARQRAGQMEDVLRSDLRRGGISVSQMQVTGGEVRFLVQNRAQLRQAENLARRQIVQLPNFGG